jgi:hypothetical protein
MLLGSEQRSTLWREAVVVAASFDEAKIHIGPCSIFGNSSIYYDGVLVGNVLKADARYRGVVLRAQGSRVSFEFCGDADSQGVAAKLVALASFLREMQSGRFTPATT